MENSPRGNGGLCTLDSDLRVISIEDSLKKILGEGIVGKRALVDSHAIKILKGRGEFQGRAAFMNSRGNVVYARCRISGRGDGYVLEEFGEPTVVDCNLRENTFLKGPVPAFIITEEQVIVEANDAFLSLTGTRREDIIGKTCYPLVHGTSGPPEGCPLVEIRISGGERNMNIMSTVFGNFLVVVHEIAPGLYGHYMLKEAAVLLEAQNRMMEMMERYNRILLTTVSVNTILMEGRDVSETLERIADKIMEIEEFRGIRISVGIENGKSTFNIARGETEPRKDGEGWGEVVIPIDYGGISGQVVIYTGGLEIGDDEMDVLRTMANNLGMYLESRNLEMKREIAYRYMLEAMDNFAILVDRIRNPLAVIMALTEVEIEDEELREKIISNVEKVQEITKRVDELWNKAEKMRDIFKGKR